MVGVPRLLAFQWATEIRFYQTRQLWGWTKKAEVSAEGPLGSKHSPQAKMGRESESREAGGPQRGGDFQGPL